MQRAGKGTQSSASNRGPCVDSRDEPLPQTQYVFNLFYFFLNTTQWAIGVFSQKRFTIDIKHTYEEMVADCLVFSGLLLDNVKRSSVRSSQRVQHYVLRKRDSFLSLPIISSISTRAQYLVSPENIENMKLRCDETYHWVAGTEVTEVQERVSRVIILFLPYMGII